MLQQPVTYTRPDDFASIRQNIFDSAIKAVQERYPLENEKYRLSIEELGYDSIPEYSRLDQKRAVQTDKTLSAKLKGKWTLTDKATGKIVSQSARKTILDVPYMTERGTFIRRGSDMTLPIQMRLVPGVYTRIADNGEAKAHINTRPGTGTQMFVTMNPAKPVFVVSQGTRNYKLYPLLKNRGISDEQMMAAWGKDIYKANFDDFVSGGGWYGQKTAAEEDPYDEISKRVFAGEVDPIATEFTLGRKFNTVTPDLLLNTSNKLLKVTRGEAEQDNRDSLENQRFFNAPDLIRERIRLDAGKVGSTLLWKAAKSGNVENIPAGALNKYVNGLFTEAKLGQAIEETNPLDAYFRATKVTRMGEGGISSTDTAPMSARLVHNTYKGFVDPVVSPECCSPNHLVMTNLGWKPISEVTTDDLVACLIDNRLEYCHPDKVVSYDFSGELYCFEGSALSYEVTGNHRMFSCKHSKKAHIHKDGRWRNAYIPTYQFELAENMHNCSRKVKSGGHFPYKHDTITSFTISTNDEIRTFSIEDWCELLGWYISEGSYFHTTNSNIVQISQVESVNKENCESISALLARMGLPFKFNGRAFNIRSKALVSYVKPLGYCYDKYIPEEVFTAPEAAQRKFMEAILRGDGRKKKTASIHSLPVLCTTSKRLSEDYERLLFRLGYSVSVKFEKDARQERYRGCYTIRAIVANECWLYKNEHSSRVANPFKGYYKKPYTGKVYCLSVPGSLFYTKIDGHRGFWVGNSLRAGLDSAIAFSTIKGSDGLMYTPMISNISGRKVMVNSIEASRVPVAFPEYRNSTEQYVPAMIGNKIEYLPRSEVKYFLPSGDSMFSLSSNMIPLKAGIKAGRLLMAQKHQTQAVSLVNRMAPYVQTQDPNDDKNSVERNIGGLMGAIFADTDGKVTHVDNDSITVRYLNGTKRTHSLYNNYHMNRKTIFHNTPEVKVGDMVKPGQVLASSNYTDKEGKASLGTQLRVAWMPYKGENYLDGIIVSEDAAKKFTSIHSYRAELDKDKGTTIGKSQYLAAFPTEFTKDQMETIDKDGTVKPGTVLKHGDPMILAYSKRASTPGSLHRELNRNAAITWEHEFPATVIDVVDSPSGVKVYTKAELPLQSGDKIVARFANKGTTARVVPTSEMPVAADGRPIEVLLGPTGIVSRVNTAQLVEAMLGKVSEKTGKRYILPGFSDNNLIDFAKKELKDAGLTDKEDVTDPSTGQVIPGVTVGNAYMVKLHHTSESKTGSRGADGGYDINELPAGGGHDSAKTLGGLILGAFQGHGAVEVTKDMKLVKGQQNSDFWRDFRLGRTPAMPKVPLVYERFLAHLQGAGINVHRDRNRTNIFALTQKDMDNLAKAEVKNTDTYASGSLRPLPGGLFDPAIFGNEGTQWGYIKLDEPILNPIMEEPVRLLLGLTASDFDAVVAGNKKLPNGQTGGAGLNSYLKSINLNDAITNARNEAKTASRTQRDKAIKKLRYLLAMEKNGATPADFMLDKVPVIPPRFRRITMADDLTMVADANYLYKELMNNVNDVRDAKAAGVPDEMVGNGRLAIYNAFKAVTGLTDPDARKLQEKQVTGLLKWVFGTGSPKNGAYQRLVVGGKLDLAGRNVINVNPSLRMDEAGLPEKNAWNLYGNFIIRKLTQRGMTPLQAAQEVDKHSDLAYKAMQEVVKERPLIITRAPALHKYSVMAFKPKLIKGDVLQLGPAVQGPFNADHDGDTMTYYVPVSDKAVKEAYNKMLPSKNLLSARDYKAHYLPQEEYILGGWLAYREGKGPIKQVFKSKQDAILAYKQGKIGLNDNIQILG